MRVPALFTSRMSDDRNTCWFAMRVRSLPSPTPWRVRRNFSASSPCSE
ncbi:hypothetical protein ACFPRL_14550 [Pseudoclavibacter helvolus]